MFAFLAEDNGANFDKLKHFVCTHKPKGVAELEAAMVRRSAKAKKEKKNIASGAAAEDGDADCDGDEAEADRRDRLAKYNDLYSLITDALTKPHVLMYHDMTKDAVALIVESEGNASSLPHDFLQRLNAFRTWIELTHGGESDDDAPCKYVGRFIVKSGETLAPEQRQQLIDNVVCALEAGYIKLRHLDHVLPMLRRRELWHPSRPPPATPAEINAAAVGGTADVRFLAQAQAYAEEWKRSNWGMWSPTVTTSSAATSATDSAAAVASDDDASAAAAARGDSIDPLLFWNQDDIVRHFPLMRSCALYHLSVPLSTAAVERSFSILRFMEQKHLLKKGDSTVEAEMFLRCNSTIVDDVLRARMEGVRDRMRVDAAASAAARSTPDASTGASDY